MKDGRSSSNGAVQFVLQASERRRRLARAAIKLCIKAKMYDKCGILDIRKCYQ